MATLRERIANVLLGPEKARLERSFTTLYNAYLDNQFRLPPEELVRQLREVDSSILQDLVIQLGYDYLGSLSGLTANTDAERQSAMRESERLFRYSPLAQWMVWTWTNFGLGETIAIKCADADADAVWQEAWKAERNAVLFADDKIQDLSNWTLAHGNTFLAAFASTQDGETTFAEIPVGEIAEIVTDPENASKPLFYKRQFTVGTEARAWYYPDWETFFDKDAETQFEKVKLPAGAVRADKVNGDKTAVCALHIAHNCKVRGNLWGWPILYIAAPYLRSHKQFMDNRLTIAAAVAMYVNKLKVQGGSRAIASVKARLQSALGASNAVETNPPAVAGSTWLENQAAELTRMPLATAAGDAEADNKIFTWQALIGGGLFPTTAGLDTSRWATALAMDKTQSMLWARYQTFWSAQFKKMVMVALNYKEKYSGTIFQSKDAEVSIDSFSIVDFPGVVESMSALTGAFSGLMQNQIIPAEATRRVSQILWRIAFKALGVTDADATSDAVWGITALPEEVQRVITKTMANYKEGKASADDVARFVLAELVENK